MFEEHSKTQFELYNKARDSFIEQPNLLIELEKKITTFLFRSISSDLEEITRNYNEASFLYPFWKNYPPDERGRSPRGDQFPWIEVGEHALGTRLYHYFQKFNAKDVGLPTGADQRFVIKSDFIRDITHGLTNSAWVFIDIKSVGPRDDFDHAVMSHNQISGDGVWDNEFIGLRNKILTATGKRTSHPFHCSVPPIYILSDGSILPVVMLIAKPVYKMLSLDDHELRGQPLNKITVAAIPNGLLLTENPNYLESFPELLYPGKDDKGKNPLKVRARISFPILQQIDQWRVQTLDQMPSVV
ncbi:MAG: BglI family type II restriction endonuclease [Opitutales bacterium]|nr:BglI family type II restriction endonuclease [Opitutales bacterium]